MLQVDVLDPHRRVLKTLSNQSSFTPTMAISGSCKVVILRTVNRQSRLFPGLDALFGNLQQYKAESAGLRQTK